MKLKFNAPLDPGFKPMAVVYRDFEAAVKAEGGEIYQQKERASERHSSKGHRILATIVANHSGVGKLRGELASLCNDNWCCKANKPLVVWFIIG